MNRIAQVKAVVGHCVATSPLIFCIDPRDADPDSQDPCIPYENMLSNILLVLESLKGY